MMEWVKKNRFLIFLCLLGIAFFVVSILLYNLQSPFKGADETAKALMGLAFTTIIGGLIKGILDRYQEENKKEEERRVAEKARQEEIREFKLTALNQLRKVFDDVDSARLIIEAHRSARTYSDKMQQNIIPSIVRLYDIKRSLVDSKDMIEQDELLKLRVNIHYMIAYLQALADEYKERYLEISNRQFHYEKLKEERRKQFVDELLKTNPADFFSDATLAEKSLPETPQWVWKSILELTHMPLFVNDTFTSPYRKMFVDFYENCKKILKAQENKKFPEWLRGKDEAGKPSYDMDIESMDRIAMLAENESLKEDDSLVEILMAHLTEKIKESGNTTKPA